MFPRTGSSSSSSTPLAHAPRQEPPAPQAQATPRGPGNLPDRRAPASVGGHHAPRTAGGKGKDKASAVPTPGACAPEPVALLREHAATLMALDMQRRELLQEAQAAGLRGPALAVPSAAEMDRLSDAVDKLESKAEELARQAREAKDGLARHASQLAHAAQGLERLAGKAEQAAAQDVPAGSQPPRPVPQDRPGAAAAVLADAPQALVLRQAMQQRDEAQRQLADAQARFGNAIKAEKQRQQDARNLADKLSRQAGLANSFSGLLQGMGNKTDVDGRTVLKELGLPPLQTWQGADDHKDSLQQEFETYRAGLTECRPDGRWQFRDAVRAGLPRLMAFDALVRTSLFVPVSPVAITACIVYERCHPGLSVAGLDPGPEIATDMARRALDSIAAGWDVLSGDELAQASGRQKVDKAARQAGVEAPLAKTLQRLRKKDIRTTSAFARKLRDLLQDHRAELESTLGGFMLAGLVGIKNERARLLAEAEAARQRASRRDPALAALTQEVQRAHDAVRLAKANVQELEPLRRNPPPGTAAAPLASLAAAVPQIPRALPGPGLARDPETRIAKQRGRMLDLETARESAQQHLGEVSAARGRVDEALLKARDRLDGAMATHVRAHEAARQEQAQQRALRSEHGTRLKALDGQIKAARAGLREAPALQSLIDSRALQRVIEIHVDPDDQALRQRALQKTGLNGRYDSLAHLAEALADVHEGAKSRFPELFAAGTPAQFEQAAQAHPAYDASLKALVNLPHDHHRLVGYGYDAKPDRTSRLIPLTRSEYGLAWRGDGVKVSHLHPGVPRRTLRSLDRPPE